MKIRMVIGAAVLAACLLLLGWMVGRASQPASGPAPEIAAPSPGPTPSAAAAEPAPGPDAAALKKQWLAENEKCRGSYDEKVVARACPIRDRLQAELERVGWCWEYPDRPASEAEWHRCGQASAAAERSPRITAAQYSRVANGMTYDEVVEILGSRGTENASSGVAGISTVVVTWQNYDSTGMNAMFQNGRLVMKSQFGLR